MTLYRRTKFRRTEPATPWAQINPDWVSRQSEIWKAFFENSPRRMWTRKRQLKWKRRDVNCILRRQGPRWEIVFGYCGMESKQINWWE